MWLTANYYEGKSYTYTFRAYVSTWSTRVAERHLWQLMHSLQYIGGVAIMVYSGTTS